MLRTYPDNYGQNGKFPTASDFIDFTKVNTGTEFYFFATSNDEICTIGQVQMMEEQVQSHKRTHLYDCDEVDHMWFGYRGYKQNLFVNDMILALGEGVADNTLVD